MLLRPQAALNELFTLTGWVAVAAREGVAQASGAPVEIKWLNDLYLHGRKLCGILTELAFLGESAEPDYVVVGRGVNMNQTAETFKAQRLEGIAASLAGEGFPVERHHLALCLLRALDEMVRAFPENRADWLERYRARCLTTGRRVSFETEGGVLTGTAAGIDEKFGLKVAGDDGKEYTVSSGTVKLL